MTQLYDDPFDPSSDSLDNETKPWDEVIRLAIETALLELHTWLPAKIVQVRSNQSVDVQPLLKRRLKTGELVSLPVIQDVRVEMPSGAGYWIKLPVSVGDVGRVVFCERSLDAWSAAGGEVDPNDTRHHDLSDAVFVPGIRPKSGEIAGAATDLIVHNGTAEMAFQQAGTYLIKGAGNNELMNILNQLASQLKTLAQTLSSDTVNTMLGPEPLNAFSTYSQISSAVSNLVSQLTQLKGA